MKPLESTGQGFRPLWWILPALVIGILLSLLIPKPMIGVIRLNDAIYAGTAKDLIAQINYARDHPEISRAGPDTR